MRNAIIHYTPIAYEPTFMLNFGPSVTTPLAITLLLMNNEMPKHTQNIKHNLGKFLSKISTDIQNDLYDKSKDTSLVVVFSETGF